MDRFSLYGKRVFVSTAYAIVLASALWLIVPENRIFFQSLILGMLTSLLNGWIAFMKTKQVADPESKVRGTGMFSRLLLSVFAIYLTMRFPEIFTLSGVLIGLFVTQFFSLIFALRSI